MKVLTPTFLLRVNGWPSSLLKLSNLNQTLIICTNTRGHSLKLYEERVNKNVLNFSFGIRVIDQWNNLPEEVIPTTSINSYKTG